MYSYGIGENTKLPKSVIYPLKPIQFEKHTFPGPGDVEGYLNIVYGNYMDLPPIENRNHHEASYKIWD